MNTVGIFETDRMVIHSIELVLSGRREFRAAVDITRSRRRHTPLRGFQLCWLEPKARWRRPERGCHRVRAQRVAGFWCASSALAAVVSSEHPIQVLLLFSVRLQLEWTSYHPPVHASGHGRDTAIDTAAEVKIRWWRTESPVFWWWGGWRNRGLDLCSDPLLPPTKVEEQPRRDGNDQSRNPRADAYADCLISANSPVCGRS